LEGEDGASEDSVTAFDTVGRVPEGVCVGVFVVAVLEEVVAAAALVGRGEVIPALFFANSRLSRKASSLVNSRLET
jgi:hypothetical protein